MLVGAAAGADEGMRRARAGEKGNAMAYWLFKSEPEAWSWDQQVARGKAGEYKSGGTRLAVETGQPVVPIAMNSAVCWPRKSFLLRPGVIDVSIGPMIPSAGRTPAELMKDVQQWIETEMRVLDPAAYPAGEAGTATSAPPPAPAKA